MGEVIGDLRAAVPHRLAGAVGPVDVLAPDDVVDAEFAGPGEQEVSDRVAQLDALRAGWVTGDEDVQRSAVVVLTVRVGPKPADLLDLRECLHDSAFGGDRATLQPRLGAVLGGVGGGDRRTECTEGQQSNTHAAQYQRHNGHDGQTHQR